MSEGTQEWLWVACLGVSALGGVIPASSWFLDWPAGVLGAAPVLFILGVLGFGVLTYVDSRREGVSTWTAARRGTGMAIRAFIDLFP